MRQRITPISINGQVTMPADVRRQLGVGAADKLAFVEGDRVELHPVRCTVADLTGIVPALPRRETIDFDDQIAEALDGRVEW